MSSSSDWTSRAERPGDGAAIESLLDRSFGTDRKVARISYRFREGRAPLGELCRVAESGEGAILACARAWEVMAGGARLPLFGPLAVEPQLRGQGMGRSLLAECLATARRGRWPGGVLVGEAEYYRPFGFRPAGEYGLVLPLRLAPPGGVDSARFLALEFSLGGLQGVSGEILPLDE
ncbi:MAG: N-acetyltransferase [Alphaproteobacteria bacterium]|nr:N-acetyltransferase [Alphaproteobacteria bacterium]MDA7982625.1 N-acetyltransferase [Alphaproteobacteria bacterium]MDA7988187.1 N-acetyltransferase [Alphaproteobacteria bacterium]MDA8009736.1 N-acetyltransferase [Alphaproteobacteria bacterium]